MIPTCPTSSSVLLSLRERKSFTRSVKRTLATTRSSVVDLREAGQTARQRPCRPSYQGCGDCRRPAANNRILRSLSERPRYARNQSAAQLPPENWLLARRPVLACAGSSYPATPPT